MASKHPPTTVATDVEAETRLREALAKVKVASDRHAAVVSAMSRLGATPAERRLAQSERKKIDRELLDAKRLLRDVQAAAPTSKGRSAR